MKTEKLTAHSAHSEPLPSRSDVLDHLNTQPFFAYQLDFPVSSPLSPYEGGRVTDIPRGTLRSATQNWIYGVYQISENEASRFFNYRAEYYPKRLDISKILARIMLIPHGQITPISFHMSRTIRAVGPITSARKCVSFFKL